MKFRAGIIAAIAAAATLTACAPPPVPAPAGWSQAYLSRDGAESVISTATPDGGLTVTAPRTNIGSLNRVLVWRDAAPVSRDHISCATTTHSGLPVQEGVALRVAPSPNGGTRGITVQKNIMFGVDWAYNVHLWDTARPGRDGAVSYAHLAGYQMPEAIGAAKRPAQARRLCARTRGNAVDFKVWDASAPEPAWNDATHVRSVPLPADWNYEGRPGLYIGHVPGSGWAKFTALEQGAPAPAATRPAK